MQLSRVRFTVRRLMVVVAACGACLALLRSNAVLGLTLGGVFGLASCGSTSEAEFSSKLLKILIGYCVLSMVTIPFVDLWWLGEIPPLALVQGPKLTFADWLRAGVVMRAIRALGLSRGSFSPDYQLGRPYALALAYLIPLGVVVATVGLRTRRQPPFRRLISCLLIVAAADYVCTLVFAAGRSLSLY